MSEQIDIDINVNMSNVDDVDELTAKLQEVTAEVESLQDALDEAHINGDDIEADIIADQLYEATQEAEALQEQLDNIDSAGLDDAKQSADYLDDSLKNTAGSADDVNEKLEETGSSASSLGTAVGGIAGMVGLEQMVSTADNVNNSWKRLELTFKGTGVSVEQLQSASTQTAEITGRSGSQVRGYFNQMGIAGVTNVDLLSQSFEKCAGFAYQNNTSVETVTGSMQKMVLTGNAGTKTLYNLGLSSQDLANVMGVSVDEVNEKFKSLTPEERLAVINQAMGDGKEANEAYKNSYEGLKNQATISMAGLFAAIGQGILPVLTPIIQTATGVVKSFTGAFKGLPGPVQAVVGGIGGFLAVGTAVVGVLGLIGQVGSGVVDGLKSLKSGYDSVKSAMGTAKAMMDALRNSESISEGVRAALAIATGAEATAEAGGAAAKGAAVGPTAALAAAENSLLWPILLVVAAVIAVIAVMWYLYNTNETVRNGINWLAQQIQSFIASLAPIAGAIMAFVTNGIAYLSQFPGKVWNLLLQVIAFVSVWRLQLIQWGINAATGFINSVGNALRNIGSTIQSALSGVYNFIVAPFRQAYEYVYNNVIKPLQDAWNWLGSAFSGYEGYAVETAGYAGMDTLNNNISTIAGNSNNTNMTVNNHFNGLVEESAAEYIVNAVNDKLKREKLLKGV